jgi:hypothetical protein
MLDPDPELDKDPRLSKDQVTIYTLEPNMAQIPVFRIRSRIRIFLGLPDPDPLVRSMDPDPSIIMQK